MNDMDLRLIRCFRGVFPQLDESAVRQAKRSIMEEKWDSLASVTLIHVVEQEFGVTIDLFDLEALDSYAALRQYLLEAAVTPNSRTPG